jgi:hypothetical protein
MHGETVKKKCHQYICQKTWKLQNNKCLYFSRLYYHSFKNKPSAPSFPLPSPGTLNRLYLSIILTLQQYHTKQDNQFTYNVTLSGILATTVVVEEQ